MTQPLSATFNHQVSKAVVFPGLEEAPFDPAEDFHQASKITPSQAYAQLPGQGLLQASPDLQFRTQFGWRRLADSARVGLPLARPCLAGLSELWARRHSCASFGGDPLALEDLADLLFAANGLLPLDGGSRRRRTVPSAGGLYPVDVYVHPGRVGELASAIYYYHPAEHTLIRVAEAGSGLSGGFVAPEEVGKAGATIFLAANFPRTRFKYGQRGYRWALLEAGHCAQNLVLSAAARGLAACPYGSFYDDAIDRAIGLDGVNEGVLYLVLVGSRPPSPKP